MPFFPESLFVLSERDHQVTWLDPLFAQINPAGAAVTSFSEVIYTVPNDRSLLLQGAFIGSNPGAGQIGTSCILMVRTPNASLDYRLAANYTRQGADVNMALNWSGSLLIPSGWRIAAVAEFDAGVAVNAISADVLGLLLPNGNIQRV